MARLGGTWQGWEVLWKAGRDCERLRGTVEGWEGLGKAGKEWRRLGGTVKGWEGLWKAGRDCGRLKMLREGRGKTVWDRERLEESGNA